MRKAFARILWFTCLVTVASAGTARAGDFISELPGSTLWQAVQSYPDGRQHDPRLDRPVRLWSGSITLAEAFATVEEQTGVRIDFWPPGDPNERVRITAYLNPDTPPALRDLMAQIGWVTDCSFAVQMGSDNAPAYHLLGTSIGRGVVERIEAEKKAWLRAEEEAKAESRHMVAEGLKEYCESLSLPPEEAVSRYAGKDDMLLLCLTHPAYRATTNLACSLSDDDLGALFRGDFLCRAWEDWTPEQREYLTVALGFEDSWLEKGPLKVWVAGPDHGYLKIHPWIETTDEFPGGNGGTFRRTALLRGVDMNAVETVALRRAMGEQMSDAEARELTYAVAREIADHNQKQQAHSRTSRLRSEPALSPACRDRLRSITLNRHSRSRYALWEVQEAVAVASGMHVISDCFAQPDRSCVNALTQLSGSFPSTTIEKGEALQQSAEAHVEELDALSKQGKPRWSHPEYQRLLRYSLPVSALDWLTALCHPWVERWNLVESYMSDCTGSEWGDAGSFLRFRSLNRDLWRASVLPEDVVDYIDAKTQGTLESVDPDEETSGWAMPPWSLVDRVYLAGRLSHLQARFGGVLLYGDPTQPGAAARHHLRKGIVWDAVAESLRFLATFSEEQWQRLFKGGVRWADLTPDQKRRGYAATVSDRVVQRLGTTKMPDNAILVIRGLRGDPDPAMPDVQPEIAAYNLEVHYQGEIIYLPDFDARPRFSSADVRRALQSRPPILPDSPVQPVP